ncbi:amino acid ABC transporter permease [Flexistipes sinusarabici]|uniref:amino acid ABC transporter permease n=1 Tax=Flexistipes sinusarabici TaxID=2352 RepID=UPI002353D3DE|nr:amino acid ABC transporter permease [Flexistipes sinusarabici]
MIRTGKIRFTLFDFFFLGLLFFLFAAFLWKVHSYLMYDWQWGEIFPHFFYIEKGSIHPGVFMQGIFYTIKLSVWSIIFATILGTVLGILRSSNKLFRNLISITFVEVHRNIPPIVLIFISYFFIGDQLFNLLHIDSIMRSMGENFRNFAEFIFAPLPIMSSFFSGVLALTVYEAAYISEIVKSGIMSVPKNQVESAYALGMNKYKVIRYVILPQAFRRILPPLASQFVSTIKDSAIVSVIAVPELTFQGLELMSATFLTMEIWIVITLLYFILTFTLSKIIAFWETRYTF